MGLFDALDAATSRSKNQILRAPFGWPGGKSKSLEQILPHLPYREKYVEAFGGSGAVLLARAKSKIDVYNDRYGGVVCFYQCLRDPALFERLTGWLELSLHAREEFSWCKETWSNHRDPVERAARWYSMIQASFGSIGRNWGRQVNGNSMAGKIQRRLQEFPALHERLKDVQIENQDWADCLRDYDDRDAVFYLDPPYVDVNRGTYKSEMSIESHRALLETVFSLDGYVAVSGYSNPLYEEQDWDQRYEWDAFVSIQSIGGAGNGKETLKGLEARGSVKEVLWVKE